MADLLSDSDVMGSDTPVGGPRLLSDADVTGGTRSDKGGKEVPLAARPFVGANRAIAGMVGAPVDAATWVINHSPGTVIVNKGAEALGFKAPIPEIQNPVGGSESIKRAMGVVGANPDDVRPARTNAEKYLEAGGEGAASMLVPGLGAEALATRAGTKAPGMIVDALRGTGPASNTAVGATSGVAGKAAEDAAPEPLKPAANIVGALLGGGIGAVATTALDRTMMAATDWAARLFEPAQVTAARQIEARAASPQKFRADLTEAAEAPPLVEGSEPTTFQATGDLGIGALERETAASPKGVAPFAERRVEQNTARLEALGKLADPAADSQAVTDYVRSRLASITDDHTAKVAAATRGVADALTQAGGAHFDNPAAYGEALQVPLSGLHQKAEAATSRLWRAIDPDMEAPVNPAPLKQGVAELLDTIPRTAKSPEGDEAAIMSTIGKLGNDTNFGELIALRSRITEASRNERKDGSPTVLRRLNIILGHVDDTLANTAGEIAADPAVRPSMIESLQAEAKEWMARSAEERKAGTIAGTGADRSGGGVAPRGAGDVPPTLGVEGQAGGKPGVPAGDQGVQASSEDMKTLSDIRARWAARGINEAVSERNGIITLSKIVVPKDARETGVGTSAMRELLDYADNTGQRIVLSPSADFGGTKSRLVDFYKSLGFEENKGRNKDLSVSETMIRDPASVIPHERPVVNQGIPTSSGVSPEVADRYAAARGATRDMKQTYASGPVGAALAPGARYGTFKMTASNVARNLFDRPEALQAFVDAAKNDPAVLAPMRDYAAFSLRQAAVKDGMLSPQRYQKWIDDHGYALRQFPELAGKFENVKTAQATLDNTFAAQKQALTEYQTGAARRFLDGQDPTQAAGKALANPGEFAALAAHVSGDPAATAGLKRAVVDYMMGKALSTAESGTSGNPQINAATLQKFYLQNRSALASLFDREELGNMERITADLQRANRSIVAVKIPGGSNTAQDIGSRAMSVLQNVVQQHGGKAAGGTIGGPVGFIAGAAVDALRAARMDRIDKAITEMMLDPKMAAIWLAKVPEKSGESAASDFIRRTRAAVVDQVMNAVEQEKRQ